MAREYTRDASEYGQQLIADAIDRLAQSSGSGGGNSGGSTTIPTDFGITVNVTQSETSHQKISAVYDFDPVTVVFRGLNGEQLTLINGANYQSFTLRPCISISVYIEPDDGYDAGELIIDGDIVQFRESNNDNIFNSGYIYADFGSTINISATPATISED